MWPFDQPPNCAAMTTRHVVREGKPVTRVSHDEVDHGWQFFSEESWTVEDAMIVAMEEIVKVDPAVLEIADLPPGWIAFRSGPGEPWRRELQFADVPEVVVDWSRIGSEAEFYEAVRPQCGFPGWQGWNLDALRDSWVTGGIDPNGPPYAFAFLAPEAALPELAEFRDAVLAVAVESIHENGGRFLPENQHFPAGEDDEEEYEER